MNEASPRTIKLWKLYLALLLAANLAYLTHNAFGWIVTLGFFLIAPGYLLLKSLVEPKTLGVATISLSVGLSLAMITICGLALNSMHFVGLSRPLQTLNIFIALDVMVLAMVLVNRSAIIQIPSFKLRLKREEWLFVSLFALLPVLAIFGAFRLNNGASNILTMIMIGLVGTLYFALAIRPTMGKVYPYAIFMSALAFLFVTSLRGWSATGHDIHHEFDVFSTTMQLGFWSPKNNFGDPYNACLSITILPTILAKLTEIDPIYVFKVVYQLAFAAIVPAVYLAARRFVTAKQALLGTFAFMTFPTFINDLPFLNRQEIAFGYFILIVFVNFSKIGSKAKSLLTVLLLLSVILAHYSTSYVTIGVLFLALIIYKVLSLIYRNHARLNIPLLSMPIMIMAFLATFAWNMQITSSSNNLSNTLTSAKDSVLGTGKKTNNTFSQGVVKGQKNTPPLQLQRIAAENGATVTYVPAETLPLTSLGKTLQKVTKVSVLNNRLRSVVAVLLQLFVVAGACILYLRYFRKSPTSSELYLLAIGSSFLVGLVLFTLVPQLSIGYDVTRLFQQSLIVLWLPVIVFFGTAFKKLGKYKHTATAFILVMIYFNLSGFSQQLTGGFTPNLALNNSGFYYSAFYTHKSDVVGSQWLAKPTTKRLTYMTIFMDINSASPPLGYPVAVGVTNGKSQGYYYTDHANNATGRYRSIIQTGFVEYYSSAYTDKKSRIYSNGPTNIYFTWPPQQ